jgi:hypothetical protein
MSNTTWLNTVARSTVVAPTHGFGMGDVCPETAVYAASAPQTGKRRLDAIQVTPGSAHVPWSPPVT